MTEKAVPTMVATKARNREFNILKNAPKGHIFNRIYNSKTHEVVPEGTWSGIESHGKQIKRIKEDSNALYFGVLHRRMKKVGIVALDINEAIRLYLGYAVQKDSEFFTLLNHHIFLMIENGKTRRLIKKWEVSQYDQKYGMEEAIVLGYEHVLFPYAWLALGITVALPMVLGEICLKRWAITQRFAKVSNTEHSPLVKCSLHH